MKYLPWVSLSTTEAVAAVPLAYSPWGSFWSQGLPPNANRPGLKIHKRPVGCGDHKGITQGNSSVFIIVKKYVPASYACRDFQER